MNRFSTGSCGLRPRARPMCIGGTIFCMTNSMNTSSFDSLPTRVDGRGLVAKEALAGSA